MTNVELDPLIQLAFSMHHNRGSYALLVGSGISRAAGIPTGYEITKEMIRRVAALSGEDPGHDLEKWYFEKFGTAPSYSDLLDRLGKTPTERHSFLRQFFEPTEEERNEGLKNPTEAHKAVAKMVAEGFIRVIITTNFDRLLELAIQAEGITPTVIASHDAVDGAVPLVHSRCTIIKINGDYLDTRAKNTLDELRQHDERLSRLLDQVFDEFGLIVCGWSGEWDHALRECIERTKGRRYGCYWCIKGAPSPMATTLMNLRGAIQLPIDSADKFFSGLEEKLAAMKELNRAHPLSKQLAVASLKRYVAEEKYRIRLHDLLMEETRRVCLNLSEARYPMSGAAPTGEALETRLNQYTNELSILLPLFINLCMWSRPENEELCIKVLERIANSVPDGNGYELWRNVRLFPASLLLCAGGIIALASNRPALLSKLLTGFKVKGFREPRLSMDALLPNQLLDKDWGKLLPGRDREYTPISNLIFELLCPYLEEFFGSKEDYENAFDRFEYLSAMIYCDVFNKVRGEDAEEWAWAPPGRFSWKRQFSTHISKVIDTELEEHGTSWLPLKAGLFSGKLDDVKLSKKRLDSFTPKLRWSW